MSGPLQEFRAELEAAETKDKKFTKRKTVLKKIVANITMGNDSECFTSDLRPPRRDAYRTARTTSVPSIYGRGPVPGHTIA